MGTQAQMRRTAAAMSGILSREDEKDAADEMELADDDEPVKYLVGEVYFNLSKDDAEAKLLAATEELEAKLAGLKTALEKVDATMAKLKSTLYAKFQNTINLEVGEEE